MSETAVTLTADGALQEWPLDDDPEARYDQVADRVGGLVQMVSFADDVTGLVNEEGKFLRLPVNPIATRLARTADGGPAIWADDVLVGAVVFVGEDDDGNFVGVPDAWRDRLRAETSQAAGS